MAVSRISKEDLTLRLEGDEAGRPALADVRRKYAWDHSTLKLPGALRLDPRAPSTAGLSKERDLVVYDSDPDEITAVEVAAGLAAAGFRVHVLTGGLAGWLAANLPAETKDAVRAVPPPAPPAPAPTAPAVETAAAKA